MSNKRDKHVRYKIEFCKNFTEEEKVQFLILFEKAIISTLNEVNEFSAHNEKPLNQDEINAHVKELAESSWECFTREKSHAIH